MGLYAATIFLSAFLLFQVQPIIARSILPWFGGSSAVWSTCMLFFQVALLLGYAYAHWLQGRFRARQQALGHTAALAASLAALPILPSPAWKPTGPGNPSLAILGLLAVTVGLPYLLLSTTTPLLQAWYARAHRGGLPYRLYALSNLASMLALLTYPVLVEPYLTTRMQAQTWSASYAVFVLLCAATAWSALRGRAEECAAADPRPGNDGTEPAAGLRFLWMALAACASVLLLAVTTFLTQDVAAVPFLWILPLSVYLLSFILCFEAPQSYTRIVWLPLLAPALAAMAYLSWSGGEKLRIVPTIAVFVVGLFTCCMVCHGELARLKPHPRHLTAFYLMVALGGALGGVFVGLVAPNLFNAYYELPLGLGLCAVLAVWMLMRHAPEFARRAPAGARTVVAAALAGYLVFLGVVVRDNLHGYRTVARNFYGQLRVEDEGDPGDETACRKLLHGVINHGQQMRYEPYRRMPVSYFCPSSGIGRAMAWRRNGVPTRVGILGLGCGTLAAYGRPGDTFRFYEINPLVPRLAQTEFTYLRDTPAHTEVVLGDGRLALEREASQQFDLLVMDAFSGDSVPVHLITREAFRTYFRHLRPSGILAVNISNKYLDLRPVMERAAAHFGKLALLYEFTPGDEDELCFACSWVLLVDPSVYPALGPKLREGKVLRGDGRFRMWTDDYSNLYRLLK
ncbi:MAG TPA: fused MFS/spermidine synthase [Bryobacteraceae bacterium]|nr:fused MFS/spermidine synthase [Bryobacteraceae bacterium]